MPSFPRLPAALAGRQSQPRANSYGEGDDRLTNKSSRTEYYNMDTVPPVADPNRGTRQRRSGSALEPGTQQYAEKNGAGVSVQHKDGDINWEFEESERRRKRRRNLYILAGTVLILLVIFIPVGVVVGQNNSDKSAQASGASHGDAGGPPPKDVPKWAVGTYLDPSTWYDTTDFNTTFTSQKVGGLYVMGLNDTWNDDTQCNPSTPKLTEKFDYGNVRYRGINLGGWLSIEPFITPSLFDPYPYSDGVLDEYSLSEHLGADKAAEVLEKHYATWMNEETFKEVAEAGFDHVRLPFSYWAIKTYPGDPYVPMISWRYLLRGIEWARKYGLRVYLDIHGLPGSQNGWNHSGHQGTVGWLNGTDGDLNGQRSLEIHQQLTTFFAQPRYKNIITMYGLCNEPRMDVIEHQKVFDWNEKVINMTRSKGYDGLIIMGDGQLALTKWQGKMQGYENLVLDAHQYLIFESGTLEMTHHEKVNYACGGWGLQTAQSMDTSQGFGPTMFSEWSQADTDCTKYVNNVGVGSRWEGTLNWGGPGAPVVKGSGDVLKPSCPTQNDQCSCDIPNANPSTYSDAYKQFLVTFAEAQIDSWEQGWGWFYWTWRTESAPQWSWKDGSAAGILPKKANVRTWYCNMTIPSFDIPEYY